MKVRLLEGGLANQIKPRRVARCMIRDFFEDVFARGCGCPAPEVVGRLWIEDDPGNIEGAGFRVAAHIVGSEAFCAPVAELAQGHCAGGAAGEVEHAGRAV